MTPTAYLGSEPVKGDAARQRGITTASSTVSVVVAKTALAVGQIVFVLLRHHADARALRHRARRRRVLFVALRGRHGLRRAAGALAAARALRPTVARRQRRRTCAARASSLSRRSRRRSTASSRVPTARAAATPRSPPGCTSRRQLRHPGSGLRRPAAARASRGATRSSSRRSRRSRTRRFIPGSARRAQRRVACHLRHAPDSTDRIQLALWLLRRVRGRSARIGHARWRDEATAAAWRRGQATRWRVAKLAPWIPPDHRVLPPDAEPPVRSAARSAHGNWWAYIALMPCCTLVCCLLDCSP